MQWTQNISIGATTGIGLADVASLVKKRKQESVKHIIHYERLTAWFIDVDVVHYYSVTSVCARVCRNDPTKFREDLMNIARTTLSSKILTQYKDHFSNLAVTAVLRLKVSRCLCCF